MRNFGKCGYTASLFLDFYKQGKVDLTGADYILIMQPNDGLHFGEVGYETIAKFIAEELKKYVK